ncbi:putative fungal specific transcription factor [Lyophyllum shimeji]|uniref:Fungal specific transcription factor n=1 Tax=Lyophyllum shimeji TaxID=47721 RepID=A0A9P3PQF2_LYOSH|nr:putative fungal specific transcription factor [Lyophyllum shimeji]
MKADSAKRTSTSTARGRGTYAAQACSICRGKKTKCDGNKPVCGPCASSGRQDECSWGRESGRKPRTEAHFEAMRKRADALEEYVNLLESVLEKCRREHGGATDNGQSYLQFRPRDAEGMILPDECDVDGNDNDDPNNEDQAFTQELCLPTRNLKLEEGNLLLHGNTAVFRFAPEPVIPQVASRFPLNSQAPRYVLLVDGVDEQNYNPDFDWSRYLPASVPLDRKEHDKLLDLLFKFFMSWCLRIVPDLFLRDMHQSLSTPRSQTPPKTAHYSPMLHNALIAVATAFSDDPRIRDIKSRQAFAANAKSYIESECQQPNISVMHALSVLGSYHSGLGEQTLGYLYFGMSARISQALGLSIDCSAWVKSGLISEHDMFDRNWAYWTTFTQDVCWSLYVGRDFSIPSTSDGKRIPIPSVDPQFDSVPWYHPPSGVPPQPNFLSTTFAASCELLMIARRIMDVVNGLNNASVRHEVNHELISNIDLKLNTWKSNLSANLDITLKSRPTATPHKLMMHCTYWWFFILLHRPFYQRKHRPSDRDIDHVKLCKRAAENIVELLGTWRSLYTLRYAPITLVQAVFSAGTIYLLGAVQAATGLRVAQESLKHALAQAQLCVQYLFEIGKSWQCATNIGEILRRLLQEQLKPLLDRRAIRDSGQGSEQNRSQPHNGGVSLSPGPSREAMSRRRRSPSQHRSSSRRDEVRSRGRPLVPAYLNNLSPTPSSSSHRSPIPSSESYTQSHPPSQPPSQSHSPSFSMQQLSPSSHSCTQQGMMFNHSWSIDYTPASPSADDAMSPLFQHFGGSMSASSSGGAGSGGGEGAGMGMMDVDLGSLSSGVHNNSGAGSGPNTGVGSGGSVGMDPSSFLAMLGGEPLSNAPFLPTFDSYSPPAPDSAPYSPQSVRREVSRGFESSGQAASGIPTESDLAVLAQFWEQNFREMA